MSAYRAMPDSFIPSGKAMATSFTSSAPTIEQSLQTDQDLVRLRTTVRERAVEIGLSLVDQTKMVTAASELGRNTVRYGGGGEVQIAVLSNGLLRGLRIIFIDRGPGIADVALALTDGYTSGNGLGLGLGGAKRLVDEFELVTEPGAGTTVTITKWKK
jgi:serine/threonine-protein kinase RsbT